MKKEVQILKLEGQKEIRFNPFSYITVSWLSSLLWKGSRKTIEQQDLYVLPKSHRSNELDEVLEPFWKEFRSGKGLLAKYLWKHIWWKVMLMVFLQLCSAICELLVPLLLQQIIYLITPGYDRSQLWIDNGILLPFVVSITQIASALFNQNALQLAIRLQIDLRAILIGAIYKKSLVLSHQASQEFTSGVILNTVNVDVEKVLAFWNMFSDFVIAPVHISLALVLLTRLIGVSTYAGLATLVFILGMQLSMTPYLEKLQSGFLAGGDKRLKLLREVLNGIRVVKFKSLEPYFYDKISAIRQSQMYYLVRYYTVQAFYIAMYQITPISLPVVAFIVYGAQNNTLTASVIFPALTLFITLIRPIESFPEAVTNIVLGFVSWKRVRALLLAEEGTTETIKFDESATLSQQPGTIQANLNSYWKADNSEFKLSLNIDIKQGQKVAIVGQVGSGKSSVLSALIGDMPKESGSVQVNGTISYCAQQPWILSDSIQNNILFNYPLDEDRLQRVLRVTDLVNDLDQFESGLLTLVGEKGVNLSGGQKARVALARALYKEADVILLDDVLAALDSQVGKQVFEKAIKKSNNTVVLVTHHLYTLQHMDHIIVMDQGQIIEQGSFQTLMDTGHRLPELMKDLETLQEQEEKEIEKEGKDATRAIDENAIIVAEDKESGSVSFAVFKDYILRAGGIPFLIMVTLSGFCRAAMDVVRNVFLSWWIRDLLGWSTNDYLTVYGLLGLSQYFFALFMNGVFTYGAYKAASYYHPKALSELLKAPISFFDSQPIGRILNRFSKDIESVDQMVWIVLFVGIVSAFIMLAALTFMVYVDYRMLAAVIPLMICYYVILRFYQKSNIEFKRLESISKSPLYAHVSETLAGISTLKAFGGQDSFIAKQLNLMDACQQPVFMKQMAGIWITIRLRVLASSLTLCMGLLGTLASIDPTIVGLALTYAINFIQSLGLLLFAASYIENEFNSVERLSHYCTSLPHEKASKTDNDPKKEWPDRGHVVFDKVSFRYPSRPDRTVLKNLSFEIQPGHKIGIVGRTGSGKSTIMSALFRLIEIESGSITIDGIDFSTIGISTLRKSLQCIPQDPVLFSGTVRENLDLEHLYTDDQIWHILEQIGFKEYISNQPLQLDALVEENGGNLSVGQRQLLCLGRALLVNPYLLIMDEATASLDHESDQLIQQCIKKFPNTVISIAHRLNTIIDFDRVLVLEDGEIMDYDIPHVLLDRPGIFADLCDATGPQNSKLLRSIASQKYQSM